MIYLSDILPSRYIGFSLFMRPFLMNKYFCRLELKIHGIDEVGPNVKHDLVSFLKKRLDEKVVDILSTLLLRNPMSKLTPEDVLFLQKDVTKPSNVVKFRLNPASETFLEALQYYLRQNVVAG